MAFSIAGGAEVVRSASVWNRMGGFKELRHIDLHLGAPKGWLPLEVGIVPTRGSRGPLSSLGRFPSSIGRPAIL